MQNLFKFIFAIFLIPIYSFSQDYTIKGIVFDKKSNETIPMVNIVLKSNDNIMQGAVSNMNGEYSLSFNKQQNENYRSEEHTSELQSQD